VLRRTIIEQGQQEMLYSNELVPLRSRLFKRLVQGSFKIFTQH
jgi:hypothetical protein